MYCIKINIFILIYAYFFPTSLLSLKTPTRIPCIYKLLQNMLKLSKYNELIQL